MQTWRIKNEAELEAIAKAVLDELSITDQAAVLALHGDLGAGKTTFTQILGKLLGVKETITSPTFVVIKRYESDNDSTTLVHIDAYRIEDIDEMRVLSFEELLQEKDTIIGIEWAEKIASLLPEHTRHLTLTIEGDQRIVTLT